MRPTPAEPMIIYGQPEHEYRSAEGISQSSMKELLTSPAHYLARYGPDAQPFYPTAAMIQGTAVHMLALEGEEHFAKNFGNRAERPKELTIPEMKACLDDLGIEYPKAAKKSDLELLLFPAGKNVDKRTQLDSEVYADVCRAAEALRTHELTGAWFNPEQPLYRKHNEVSIFVRNELGQTLKGRIDRLQITQDSVRILDLKTTANAEPREFQRTAANLKYDLQAAWYHFLVSKAFPDTRIDFLFVALERKAPFGISVFKASESLLESGRRKMGSALDKFAQCKELDYWPAYEPVVHDLELPAWADRPVVEVAAF